MYAKQMEWIQFKWNDQLNMNGYDKCEINKWVSIEMQLKNRRTKRYEWMWLMIN